MPLLKPGDNAFTLPKEESGLYTLETDGSVKKRLDKVNLANGLGWSPDNRIMYFIDTPLVQVHAFDFDLNSGNMCEFEQLKERKYTFLYLCSLPNTVYFFLFVSFNVK